MNPASRQLIAEVLAEQLGMSLGELDEKYGADPIKAVIALSINNLVKGRDRSTETADHLARVAAIVGACPLCLGWDAVCIECRGVGKPGSRMIVASVLLEWVHPALRRAGLHASVFHRDRPEADHKEGGDR